jgi:AraC-like DNA-binding protein
MQSLFAVSQAINDAAAMVVHPATFRAGDCTTMDLFPATANEKRGRRARHVDAAARKRAHRANLARVDYADDPAIVVTIGEIADQLGYSRAEVMKSLVRFALTNRNWKQVGLYGSKGA